MKKGVFLVSVMVLLLAASVSADVVINEVMVDPDFGIPDADGEYIELYNTDPFPADITGWILRDDGTDSHVITGLVIPAEDYVVLCRVLDIGINGGVICDYPYGTDITLANAGDEVILDDGMGGGDIVVYNGGFPISPGESMELINPGLENNDASNWDSATTTYFPGGNFGTPGIVNSVFDPAPSVTDIQNAPLVPALTDDVTICATVTDNNLAGVELDWNKVGSPDSGTLVMTDPDMDNQFCRIVSAGTTNPVDGDVIEYTVNATDGVGNEVITSIVSFTYDGANPIADLTAGEPYTCAEGSIILLDGSNSWDTVDPALDYTWDLDNDLIYETDTGNDPTVAYNCVDDTSSPFTVSMQVTDDAGYFDTTSTSVAVSNVNPAVMAPADDSVEENTEIIIGQTTFSDEGIPDTHTATIDWGDGTPVENINGGLEVISPIAGQSHTYLDNGIYTVTITVTDDDGGVGSDSLTVTVTNAIPVVTASIDTGGEEGAEITIGETTFTDAGTLDTHTAEVDWGDGNVNPLGAVTDPVAGQSHTYADNGIYVVTITVTDNDGGSGFDTLEITVTNVDPVVIAPADTDGVEDELITIGDVTFTDAGSGDTHTATIDWGDETVENINGGLEVISPIAGQSHTYSDNGIYTVTITVTDDDGGFDSDTLMVTITNYLIELDPGWNLVSLPLVPESDDTAVETVLADVLADVISVWSYQEGEWLYYFGQPGDTLTDIEPGYGYFVRMANGADIYLNGERMYYEANPDQPSQPPSVDLIPGWNLIGHYGQEIITRLNALTTIGGNDATLLDPEGNSVGSSADLFPGMGYWLFITGLNDVEYAPSDLAYP